MSQDNFFPHVGVWVHEYLLESVTRKVNDRDTFWCSSWWKHTEAVERLTALWITWEQARNEPETFSAWWRDHLDHHLPILMSSTGPFRYCLRGEHKAAKYAEDKFPVKPFPDGLFDFLS